MPANENEISSTIRVRMGAGDFIEATGHVTKVGNTSRTVEFEAWKVIASRYDLTPSAADVLETPVLVCRATGTTVVPKDHSRMNPSAT